MASIFDNFPNMNTLNLTPDELKQLQARGGTAVEGARTGTYLPPEQPVSQASRVAGLLEADPVSTQQQSRVGPQQGRTFYTNTAGQTGTSVPKGSGTSGIYETAADAAEGGGKGAARGLLGRAAGAVFGPVGMGVQAALTPGQLGNGELTPEQQQELARQAVQNMGPEVAGSAVRYGQDVSNRAVDSALGRTSPISLMNPNPEEATIVQDNAQPPVEETPVGPVAEANPTTVPQAAAKTMQDQEVQRQTLEAGALKGLSTGEVSRPKLAAAVVEADVQRSGKELTPEQTKAAVTQELTAMKTMNNSDLSRYVSYALMAAGVLAALLDKSGKAGDAFSASFNKQLDRNLAAGLQNQKLQAASNKQAQDLQVELAKLKQGDRGLDIKEKGVDQTGRYQEGQLDLGAQKVAATRESTAATTKLGYDRLGQDASQFATTTDLKRQGLLQRQTNADRDYQLAVQAGQRDTQRVNQAAVKTAMGIKKTESDIKLNDKKINAEGGVTLTSKDATKIVQEYENNQGISLGDNRATVASAVMNAAKNDPSFKNDPAGAITKILTSGGYVQEGKTLFGYGSPRIKQKKQ